MRGEKWLKIPRGGIILRRFFAVILFMMFVLGLVGWIDGWGDNVTQEVTNVLKEEASPFSSPALVDGTLEYLAHVWFDYENGTAIWDSRYLIYGLHSSEEGELLNRGTSTVKSVSVESIQNKSESTAEVTAIVLRELQFPNEQNEIKTEYRMDQIRVPLIYEDGKMHPMSGPVIEEQKRIFGKDNSVQAVQVLGSDMEKLNKLAESYVSSLSNGNKDQIEFLFENQSQAPDPVQGDMKLLQVIPIKESDNTVTIQLQVKQTDETGIAVNQIHVLQSKRNGDRYLIQKVRLGGIYDDE